MLAESFFALSREDEGVKAICFTYHRPAPRFSGMFFLPVLIRKCMRADQSIRMLFAFFNLQVIMPAL